MRSHTFQLGSGRLKLRDAVGALDRPTRQEGFHVLQGWDPVANRFPDEIIPVLMLDYCARAGVAPGATREALRILLDYYFVSLLSLVVVRVWDHEDPNAALDEATRLVQSLQGPRGSRCQFVDDAETLLLLAISHYHPAENAYDHLLRKVQSLDDRHRLNVALPGAAILGSHLRWGFQHMYRRDVGTMRDDNVVDYPWLLFSVLTLMRAYQSHTGVTGSSASTEAGIDRNGVVAHLLNGLTPDPWAFTGTIPRALAASGADHEELREALSRHGLALLADFEAHRPTTTTYTPLGFQFNFLPNALTAMVATTVASGTPSPVSLNALLSQGAGGTADDARHALVAALTRFSGGSPERFGARGTLLVLYDYYDAVRSYNAAVRVLSGQPRQSQTTDVGLKSDRSDSDG
jgi:hypothetical protein